MRKASHLTDKKINTRRKNWEGAEIMQGEEQCRRIMKLILKGLFESFFTNALDESCLLDIIELLTLVH